MKTKYIKAFIGLIPALGMASCMDFDTPSDEFTGSQVEVETDVYSGTADSIGYRRVPTEEGLMTALNELQEKQAWGQYCTAQYYLRGGKDGNGPQEHAYQYVYSLHIDNYAGYFVADQTWGGKLVTTYSYNREFCDGPYGAFKAVRDNVMNTLNRPQIDSVPELKAIGLLIFDYSAQEMVNVYGSVPYGDFLANKMEAPFTFDPGSKIYETIIDHIDTLNACFKHFELKPEWYKNQVNMLLGGAVDRSTHDRSIASWRRFANSLKLRMAMNCVKVMPDKAKKWAEEAVAEGVVTTTDQEIAFDEMTSWFTNPLVQIANNWNDTKLNASMESLMFSLDHPYKEYIFAKNNSTISPKDGEVIAPNTRVIGIRTGAIMTEGQVAEVNPYCAYSAFKLDDWDADPVFFGVMSQAPTYLIKVSEMEFIRAEGALRNWEMGGDAKTFYENGIRHAQVESRYSQSYYGDYVDDYMTLEAAKPYNYVDPLDPRNNHESVTKIGVAWNDSDTKEVMLEKIITQKFFSSFPYGNLAWADLRRTGYPKIFPVINAEDYSDGTYKYPEEVIRRIPLPGGGSSEGDADIANSGVPALQFDGADGDFQYAPVFWDKPDTPNF